MLKKLFLTSIFFLSIFFCSNSYCQQKNDSLINSKSTIQDTSARKNILALDTSAKKYNPKVATFRSALIPGWGQAYNKKYWKIPIIYGAYKKLKEAIILRSDTIPSNDSLIDPRFQNLSTESIRTYRNSYRQNVDYSVLFFLVFWGLNVVDATVDAHLKAFDVSDKISFRIKPGYNPYSNSGALSFVFSFKDKHAKALPSLQ
jgi:uncharacterized protein (UPF0333 family)